MHSSLFPFAPISNRPSENKLPEASNGRTARRRAVLGRVPRGGSLLGDSEYTHATRIGPTTPTQGDESLSPPTQMVMPWAQVAAVLGGTTRRPCPFPLRGRRCGNLLPRRGRRRGGAPFPSRGRANHRGNKQSPASSTSRFLQQPAHAAYCLPSRGGGPATHSPPTAVARPCSASSTLHGGPAPTVTISSLDSGGANTPSPLLLRPGNRRIRLRPHERRDPKSVSTSMPTSWHPPRPRLGFLLAWRPGARRPALARRRGAADDLLLAARPSYAPPAAALAARPPSPPPTARSFPFTSGQTRSSLPRLDATGSAVARSSSSSTRPAISSSAPPRRAEPRPDSHFASTSSLRTSGASKRRSDSSPPPPPRGAAGCRRRDSFHLGATTSPPPATSTSTGAAPLPRLQRAPAPRRLRLAAQRTHLARLGSRCASSERGCPDQRPPFFHLGAAGSSVPATFSPSAPAPCCLPRDSRPRRRDEHSRPATADPGDRTSALPLPLR
jgi:hypothetical protein